MALQAFQQRKYYYDFDPRSIGGCAAWFDGSDSNSIVYDASGLVQAWLDKSSNNRHLTQANPNNRPGYRMSGVDMSAGFQRLDTSGWLPRNYECYGIGFIDLSVTGQRTFAMMKNNQRLFSANLTNPEPGAFRRIAIHSNTTTWAGTPDIRSPVLFSMNVNNSLAANLRINGSQSTTTPTFVTTADISTIGNDVSLSAPFGIINEFIMYYGQHTLQQRRFIEGYLSHKWRTTNIIQQPSQGFVPTDISGCSLWLDATDDTKFDLSGPASNSVWIWKDKTSNGWDISQNLFTGRPTYVTNDRYKYVNFVAANTQRIFFDVRFMSNSVFNRSFSCFVVVANEPIANNCFFGTTVNSSRNQFMLGWRSGPLGFGFNGDDANMTADSMTSNAIVYPKVICFEHNSSTFEKRMWSNSLFALRKIGGSNLLGATSQCIGFAHLGLTQPYFTGRICEVLFYNRNLSADQMQTLHGYLMNKWQVPAQNPLVFPNHESFLIRNPVVRDFVPTNIRNCALWLDAGDPTTYTLNSSNVLTAWRDKSSNQNHVADICGAPLFTTNPINGKPAFYFNAPSRVRGPINIGGSNPPLTAFLVGSIDSSAVSQARIFSYGNRSDISDTLDGSGIVMIAKSATSNRFTTFTTFENSYVDMSWNNPSIMCFGYDAYSNGTGNLMLHNNGSRGAEGTPSFYRVPGRYSIMGTMGCNYQTNGNGYVFEVLMYGAFLNYQELDQVNTYLARKWNIDISSTTYRARVPATSIGAFPNLVDMGIVGGVNVNRNCILWLDAMDSNTYSVSNNLVIRLESKSVFGGSLTTSLGATYLPGYDATGLNGRPCFTTSTTAPGARLYGTYGYSNPTWSGVLAQHTVFMVFQPTSNIDASFGRIFSSFGGTGNDSTTGSGFAITTSNTVSPYTIRALRFGVVPNTLGQGYNNSSYRNPTSLTNEIPVILSYNGSNDGGAHTPTTWALGSVANAPTVTTNTWALKVGEVIVFQNTLQRTDIQRVEGYLARKWGIDLSTNHTYKYVRP